MMYDLIGDNILFNSNSFFAGSLHFCSILLLLRSVGTVTTTLTASCLVPLTILAFVMPLPYLVRFVCGLWLAYLLP